MTHEESFDLPIANYLVHSQSSGAPIQIGWTPLVEDSVDLDMYEFLRPSGKRRSRRDLSIPIQSRAKM